MKMSDKKPGKAKAKAKATKKKAKPGDAAATTAVAEPAHARQPGVERRRNHPMRSKEGYMQVLLTHPVPHCGQPGELVKVRPGFARNYLLPHGQGDVRDAAQPADRREAPRAAPRARAGPPRRPREPRRSSSPRRSITIEANANAEGHLYGSVTADQIAAALRTDNVPIDTDNVKIEGPLKELGLYTIKLHLGQDVDAEVRLWVVPTHVDEPAT